MDNSQIQQEESDHLSDIEDICGCTEIWEHLSEQREKSED